MPTLHQAPDLATLLPPGMPRWLLLDRLPDTLKRLYDLEEVPEYLPLYARTRFADCLAQSPLLVWADDEHSPLWQAFLEGRGETPLRGVIVASAASQAEVVAHLRTRLEARFYGQRRGLLRFYDPWIAAHLFSHAAPNSSWLGPLARLIWHGGTFEQRAGAGAQWQAFVAEEAPARPPVPIAEEPQEPLALEPAQEAALERYAQRWPLWRQRVERHGLREDSPAHAQRFVSACEEAERLALPREQWPDYLEWRFGAPAAAWPEDLLDSPVEARLARLQRHTAEAMARPGDGEHEEKTATHADDNEDVLALLGDTLEGGAHGNKG